jgi:hypothetical protein
VLLCDGLRNRAVPNYQRLFAICILIGINQRATLDLNVKENIGHGCVRYKYDFLLRLVSVVVKLYLNSVHAMSAFSIPLTHQRSSSRLRHLVHTYISLLSISQHHHFRLNPFRIHFVDNEFEKIIV